MTDLLAKLVCDWPYDEFARITAIYDKVLGTSKRFNLTKCQTDIFFFSALLADRNSPLFEYKGTKIDVKVKIKQAFSQTMPFK
jgi:hypothetical protein